MKKLLFTFLLLFTLSCSESDLLDTNSVGSRRIKKIKDSPSRYTEYFYQNNLLIRIEGIHNNESSSKRLFTYDSDRLLTKFELQSFDPRFNNTIIKTYEYNNESLLIKSNTFYTDINGFIDYSEYVYENNKITRVNVFDHDSLFSYYYELIYDSWNNLIELNDYNSNGLSHKMIYGYDIKINPLPKIIPFLEVGMSGVNNLISSTYISYIDSEPMIIRKEFHYFEYDSFNYPIHETYKWQYFSGGIVIDEDSIKLMYEYY